MKKSDFVADIHNIVTRGITGDKTASEIALDIVNYTEIINMVPPPRTVDIGAPLKYYKNVENTWEPEC